MLNVVLSVFDAARSLRRRGELTSELISQPAFFPSSLSVEYQHHSDAMTESVVDSKGEVKQATKYVKETENVAEKYSALTVSKNSSDVNMNVGEMPSAAFTAVPTLKSVKKVRKRDASPSLAAIGQPPRLSHVRRTRSRWHAGLCCSGQQGCGIHCADWLTAMNTQGFQARVVNMYSL